MPSIDITNKRYGKLIAIEPTQQRIRRYIVWRCICDCGKECFVPLNDLRTGNTKSCGCNKPGKKPVDITGTVFGYLVAVRQTDQRFRGNVIWECHCSCGATCYVSQNYLRRGKKKSCGCRTVSKSRPKKPADLLVLPAETND